jgi:RNase P/RNase MRP subunit p30
MKEVNKEGKMKKVSVVGYEEIGFNYNVCDELYEDGCGKDIEGRFLDVEFLKIVFEDRLENEENELMKKNIKKMLESIKDMYDDVLVEF